MSKVYTYEEMKEMYKAGQIDKDAFYAYVFPMGDINTQLWAKGEAFIQQCRVTEELDRKQARRMFGLPEE